MKIKVYSPNGKELKIYSKTLVECPLCHEVSLINKSNEDEESVDLFCPNCQLKFESFPLRKFIKLKGFVNYMNDNYFDLKWCLQGENLIDEKSSLNNEQNSVFIPYNEEYLKQIIDDNLT